VRIPPSFSFEMTLGSFVDGHACVLLERVTRR
jgi:hypothetical protein